MKTLQQLNAPLLYEKSYIMLTQFWPGALRSGTEALLEAIKLDPGNEKYKAFLKDAYNQLWKSRDLSGSDEIALRELRSRVKAAINEP